MSLEETIELLKRLVAERLDVRPSLNAEQIDASTPLMEEGLNLDSLAIVNLITAVESQFQIELGEGMLNLEVFANLRSLAMAIVALQGRASS
jgi:acyl carrier protein